jgi:hypothetical protein
MNRITASAKVSRKRTTKGAAARPCPAMDSAAATTPKMTSKSQRARALHSRAVPSGPYFASVCWTLGPRSTCLRISRPQRTRSARVSELRASRPIPWSGGRYDPALGLLTKSLLAHQIIVDSQAEVREACAACCQKSEIGKEQELVRRRLGSPSEVDCQFWQRHEKSDNT